MKKLLVLLGIMMATTLPAQETKAGSVNVEVRAEVIKPTNLMFRIRPLGNTNNAINDKLEFDFKDLVIGSTEQTLIGSYDLTLLDANLNFVEFKSVPTVTLIQGTDEMTGVEVGQGVEATDTTTNTTLAYKLYPLKESGDKKQYMGNLSITANTKKSTSTGIFTHNAYSIKATIQNQNTTGIIP